MAAIRTILFPNDFSYATERACDVAVDVARAFDAGIKLLHVVESLSPFMPKADVAALHAVLAKELERVAEGLRPYVRHVSTIVADGRPWQQIVRVVDDEPADLVIMGTHGRPASLVRSSAASPRRSSA